MREIAVKMECPNGRSPRRVITLSRGDAQHVDTIDPLSGFERGKMLDRAAARFGVPRRGPWSRTRTALGAVWWCP